MLPFCQISNIRQKNPSTSTSQSPLNSISFLQLLHMIFFFPHFLLTELCSLDFKSVFPIVSLENARERVLGWWRLAELQPSGWGSAEALALCESSQRLFMCAGMLGCAEQPANLSVAPVCKEYGYFSSHQPFKGQWQFWIQLTPIAVPAHSQGSRGQADKHRPGNSPKHLLLLLAFIFTSVLSSLRNKICTIKLEGEHSVAELAGENILGEKGMSRRGSRPWHPPVLRLFAEREWTLGAAWGSETILLSRSQTCRNLSMLDLNQRLELMAFLHKFAFIFCYRNWPTVSRTFIISFFRITFYCLIWIESAIACAQEFIWSHSNPNTSHGLWRVKVPQKSSLIPSLFCSL